MTEHDRRDAPGARPRLDLPRFEFGSTPFGSAPATTPHAATAPRAPFSGHTPAMQPPRTYAAPAHQPFGHGPSAPAAPQYAAPRHHAPQPQTSPYAMPHHAPAQPVQHQHAPIHSAPMHAAPAAHSPYIHGAAAPAMTHAAPAPATPAPSPQHAVVPAHALAPTPAPARASSINWERLEEPEDERTFLQKITPMHMGFLLVGIVLLMIISSKPGAVRTATTALPAVVDGSGTMMPVQPTPTITPATTTAAPAKVKMIRIGSGTLPATASHGGIPTAAASEAMRQGVTGGGGPSVNDGVTLARTPGERDARTREVKTGGGGDEVTPAAPVMTPGESARIAEQQMPRHVQSAAELQATMIPPGVS